MKNFYTNVLVYGSKILYRGIENDRKISRRVDYHPSLFVSSKEPTEFTTIHGEYVSEIKPGNIKDARDFFNQYEDVGGMKIYGNNRFEYAFIADTYPDTIDWDMDSINIVNIDIEVGSENGFPEPETASEPITAITMKMKDKFFVFGCGEFRNDRDDVQYIKCRDEIDLIKRFIDTWSGNHPDIITGWNTSLFDVPYLVNRITKLIGREWAERLSPWNKINDRQVSLAGRTFNTYRFIGIASLDYLELYRWFAPNGKSQESYKLDSIANVELGERKLSYEEYGNLHTLYRDNYQLFIEYNIKDVELVDRLEDKLKLIEMALTLAYDNKCNYDDVFAQVRMWDTIIYNHLRKKNMVIPPNQSNKKDAAYVGAFVKDPIIGMHNWVASFDLNSLYPHLIMQFNISPETLIEGEHWNVSIDDLLDEKVDTSMLKDKTLTPNGHFFSTEKQGFLPELMETMYNDRSKYKRMMIESQKELQTATDNKFEIEKRISRYNNLQLAKKVSLNSAYGALGNQYFRFFDVRQASAITTSGQLVIRWIEKHINEWMNTLLKTEDQDYVIASDTDSIYLSLDRLVERTIKAKDASASTERVIQYMDKVCEAKVQPFIDETYQRLAEYLNVFEQKMVMKREGLADKGIWTAKKRYIMNVHNNEGVQYAKPKVKVMGLEMIKSSTPSACREMLKNSIDIILNTDEETIIKYIDECREKFKTLPISDISFPRGVNGLQKFADATNIYGKGCPIHVRGSLIYNHMVKKLKLTKKHELIKEGEKVKFIYLKEPNTIQSNIISFPYSIPEEFDLDKYIDYDTQFEKSFVEPLKIILDSIGWRTEKVASLEDFFG